MRTDPRWQLSDQGKELLEQSLPDFDIERERDWPPVMDDVITVSEFARFVGESPYRVRCLMADGILRAEPGIEPPRLHRGCKTQRYCVFLRLKALSRHFGVRERFAGTRSLEFLYFSSHPPFGPEVSRFLDTSPPG
jgi:hypothetical protein